MSTSGATLQTVRLMLMTLYWYKPQLEQARKTAGMLICGVLNMKLMN